MGVVVREAVVEDASIILRFIRELAVYENAGHEVEATLETIADSVFGPGSVSRALICEQDGMAVGFALYFFNYSTWQARNGLYLEDLYVTPSARGFGAGKMLLRQLARIAIAAGCGRFEWSVLDWNEPAIRVYESIGAEPMTAWIRYRLSGDALRVFADG